MNVGQILETHLGWAARILGFYAKTPVFQGADEREIGLLLKLAGVRWAAESAPARGAGAAPRRRRRSPGWWRTSRRSCREGEHATVLAGAALNDAGRAGVSRRRRKELFQQVRDVPDATPRKELARARAGASGDRRWRSTRSRTTGRRRATRRRPPRRAQGAGEGGAASRRPRRWSPAGKPALAAHARRQEVEADVDAAADELLRRAGLTPAGKVRLRDGRSGESFEGDGHGRRDLHAEAVAPGGRQDPRAVASDRTRWSRSSRSPARRSSAASASERWKCGRSRRTAPRTRCRRS